MADDTYTLNYHGYYRERPWVAEITGTDRQYGLARRFVRGSREYSRSGKTSSTTMLLEPGLYEAGGGKSHVRDLGKFFLICRSTDGPLGRVEISTERAHQIARLIDNGQNFEEARLATKPE